MTEESPLPYGWIKEYHEQYQQHYYVDTKADPPRSIWVHPYEDEQFLREHPDVREKVGSKYGRPSGAPPPFDSRSSSYRNEVAGPSASTSDRDKEKEKRSFFAKLKDKAIGTKEEREAQRRLEEEQRQRALEARRQMMIQRQQAYGNRFPQQGLGGGFGGGYGGGQQGYYPQQSGYYPPQQAPRRGGLGGGGMGMGMPILGGLAGGLLLGEAMDGFGGDGGGDFGGGDGGGGDFGGGDFGGGDF
ncbi:hypothetical protein ACEPAI_836 [Sanghuangporus weigelae]